jgi:hypothetical protein
MGQAKLGFECPQCELTSMVMVDVRAKPGDRIHARVDMTCGNSKCRHRFIGEGDFTLASRC